MKNRVTGLGGVFIKYSDPAATRQWYATHLGMNAESWGLVFNWRDHANPEKEGSTIWSPFAKDSKHFEPSQNDVMINLRVENLEELLIELKKEGVEQIGETIVETYGKFAHIMDPGGYKIELWEPGE